MTAQPETKRNRRITESKGNLSGEQRRGFWLPEQRQKKENWYPLVIYPPFVLDLKDRGRGGGVQCLTSREEKSPGTMKPNEKILKWQALDFDEPRRRGSMSDFIGDRSLFWRLTVSPVDGLPTKSAAMMAR